MRFAVAATLLVWAIAACGQTQRPEADKAAAEPPAQAAAATEIFGNFAATSSTAFAVTGDASIDDTSATFSHGLRYDTQVLEKPKLDAPASTQSADTLRQLLGAASDQEIEAVELRRVTGQSIDPAAPNPGLCGTEAVTFIALAVSKPEENPEEDGSEPLAPQYLWVAAFRGAEAPGPGAVGAEFCGAFLFAREIAV